LDPHPNLWQRKRKPVARKSRKRSKTVQQFFFDAPFSFSSSNGHCSAVAESDAVASFVMTAKRLRLIILDSHV